MIAVPGVAENFLLIVSAVDLCGKLYSIPNLHVLPRFIYI
jgi:hypothetical protein